LQRLAALRLLKPGGSYIEIGRTDVLTAHAVAAIRPDLAYHLVALDQVTAEEFGGLLDGLLEAVTTDPRLLPPVTTVPLAGVRGAIQAMLRGEHSGKLAALPPLPAQVRSEGSYLVTGAAGGLGPTGRARAPCLASCGGRPPFPLSAMGW
jgi:hypothetical protein